MSIDELNVVQDSCATGFEAPKLSKGWSGSSCSVNFKIKRKP